MSEIYNWESTRDFPKEPDYYISAKVMGGTVLTLTAIAFVESMGANPEDAVPFVQAAGATLVGGVAVGSVGGFILSRANRQPAEPVVHLGDFNDITFRLAESGGPDPCDQEFEDS